MNIQNTVRIVKAGKQFSIELDGLPGAGYMWEITSTPGEMELIDQKVEWISKEIGGKSTQSFLLVAHQPGNYSLVFELKRKWEKAPVKTSKISVRVQ